MNYKHFAYVLKQHINYRLEQSKIKITDLVLEELISFALEDSNHDHLYESGSHKKGSDISLGEENFSVKSSKDDKDFISISSFRLTRFKDNLEDMKKFIDTDGKNFDKYFVLARNETDKNIKYTFYIIPSDIFCASKMEWIETTSKKDIITGWNTINNDNVKLKIVKSMSCQLWIELKKDFIKQYIEFEITKEISTLGVNRFIVNL